jgi:hypothetical protein
MLLGVNTIPSQPGLVWESWIYSKYFAASSLNISPASNSTSLNGWVAALWDVRKELGQDLTDRALMYGLKAPMAYNEDLNKHFRDRLQAGVLVVKNDFNDFIKVNKILERHGLLR